MPSLLHEGVLYVQVRHAMRCKLCDDVVESKSLHDFKECACGAVAVDGGVSCGNSVLGRAHNMEDKSLWRMEAPPFAWLSQGVIDARHAQRVAGEHRQSSGE